MADPPGNDDARNPGIDQPLSERRRMRLIATSLLILMAVVFALASVFSKTWSWLSYVRAFSEAAVVGACADWFAVVALFRRPLGLPIPHTAIIPRQKQRIGDAFGRFVARNFLAADAVAPRLEHVDAAGWLVSWLRDPANTGLVVDRLQDLAPPLLDIMSEDQLRNFGRNAILKGIDSIALAPLSARGLSVLLAQGHFNTMFDWAAEAVLAFLASHRDDIRGRVVKNSVRWLPGRIDARLSDAILDELSATIAAARDSAGHPWRAECRAIFDRWVVKLANDPLVFENFERFKTRLLDRPVVQDYLDWLGAEMEAKIRAALETRDGVVASGLNQAMRAAEHWLQEDAEIRAQINAWARRFALNAISLSRDEIGAFVAGVIARWDTETLVHRLELQVGRDLQFIRVNGTIVGGLVGLTIYIVTRLIG
jgi:uncharacterized membrane-anchored protein YjiN (DUF445 family)